MPLWGPLVFLVLVSVFFKGSWSPMELLEIEDVMFSSVYAFYLAEFSPLISYVLTVCWIINCIPLNLLPMWL